MVRANPFLPRGLRGTGAAKVPDYKLKQFVKGLPRLSSSERKELFEKQLKSSYVPDSLRRHLDELKHSGAGSHHEDPDVRFAIQHYANGGDLGREQLEKVMRGMMKITDELNREGGSRVRFKPGLNPRSSHVEEDVRRSAKAIAQQGLTEKERERLEEARLALAKRQRRADMRDPERRQALLRPGAAPALGSSIVSKDQPAPAGLSSIGSYKPGGPDNPANQSQQNPAGATANPANQGAATPFAGFHGVPSLSHTAGNALPGETPTHAPVEPPAAAPGGYSAPSFTPHDDAENPPASPSSSGEESAPPAPPPPSEPQDIEIG